MEEEDFCSSLPEATNSVLFEPCQESWTSTHHQYLNGEPDADAEEHKELLINQEQEPQQHIVSYKDDRDTPEETETWEQIIWPVCTTAPLSFGTVQWDIPNPYLGTPPLVMDSMLANETDSGTLTQTDNTSFSIHSQSVNNDLFKEAEREEHDEFDSWLLLCSDSEWMGHNLKPCDTESIQAPTTQEEEHSTHVLLDSNGGISLRPCLHGERHLQSVDPEFIRSCVEIKLTEFIEDSIEHLSLEDVPDESDILMTRQTDSEEEPTLVNGDEIAEGEQGEQIVTNEEATVASHLSALEVSTKDEMVYSINQTELIDMQQLLEDLSHLEKTEREKYTPHRLFEESVKEPEMCRDGNEDVQYEQSDEDEQTGVSEATIQAAESTENTNSQEAFNLQEDLSGIKYDQMTVSNNNEQFEQTESNQIQTLSEQIQQQDLPALTEKVDLKEVKSTSSFFPTPYEMLAEIKIIEKSRIKPNNIHEVTDPLKDAATAADETRQIIVLNGEQCTVNQAVMAHMDGEEPDREEVCRLAERLFKLEGIQRVDVVKHLDKDNNFSHAVGEEYLKYFHFTGQTLDQALRSFLNVVVLIGESQERERVLQHFSSRFHECNPDSFPSSGSVLALTCALMLLNTDLHGQHVGKSMSSSQFVSNLDGMNEGEHFNKDLLKSLYNSIKVEPLQWALDEEELKSSVLLEDDTGEEVSLRSKANPFLDVPHDKKAKVLKQGLIQRKLHADVDGKRIPWGKRGWKTFNAVLRGMVLYLQKDDYRKEQQTNEEVVSIHHSLAEEAADYTKKPHVFRLQTADWRAFLFQASSKAEMTSWINCINLVSALHSSPPFPAAVGSQRRFCRPILPASQSANTLDCQLQSHMGMLETFKADLTHLHQNPPEGRRAKAKELEEHRVRAEYLQHEICRYEAYIQVLEAWKSVKKSGDGTLNSEDLQHFDKVLCANAVEEEMEEGLKKSHSSPSLELEASVPTMIKVKRNISERRTYRKAIVPRWNKEV